MIIDLSSILKVEGSKIDFNSTVEIQEIEFMGDKYTFLEPIKVVGSVRNVGDTLQLNAQVSGRMNVNCYRCMKDIEKNFNFTMQEVLINDDLHQVKNKDNDSIHFQGNQINIRDIIIDNVLMNISMKYLCSQDCKGLCPSCGVDLNINKCECKTENIDPRFEVLKKLLNNQE
ncbi:MAG: hypothetical protein PWP27_718 [Clostridiales bacterium]|nr:hypothetical protein [Clostridiales bacterium]MDK2932908.1 hypothetical protein [Clostridiales bacterium]